MKPGGSNPIKSLRLEVSKWLTLFSTAPSGYPHEYNRRRGPRAANKGNTLNQQKNYRSMEIQWVPAAA